MELLVYAYLFFILVSLYIDFLFLILFFKNKNSLFDDNISKKLPSVSVLIPAYNEEETIEETLKAVLKAKYPKELIEVIVINDGSKDNTEKVVEGFKNVRLINKENSGKADSLNKALEIAKGEIIAVVDADSYPESDAFLKMVEYFKENNVGAVTSTVLVRNPSKFLEKLQSIEYAMIAFARKLFDRIGSVYVTPGALSMYRKSILKKIGGFDAGNITEDIEISWRLLKNKYKIRMCLNARCYTSVPRGIKKWWWQRIRWNMGGIQTSLKYKDTMFRSKYGMLGMFVSPFFVIAYLLSLLGFTIFSYLIIRRAILSVFSIKDSFIGDVSPIQLEALNLLPSVFTFFALILIVSLLMYLTIGLKTITKDRFGNRSKMEVLLYLFIYVVMNPINLIHAIFRYVSGNVRW